jgi:predicted sulfurtransferase
MVAQCSQCSVPISGREQFGPIEEPLCPICWSQGDPNERKRSTWRQQRIAELRKDWALWKLELRCDLADWLRQAFQAQLVKTKQELSELGVNVDADPNHLH